MENLLMAGAFAMGVVLLIAPTCIFLIAGIVAATLTFAQWNAEIFLALFILLGHFILGFIDDYLKVVRKHNQGLLARYKLAGQILIVVVTTLVASELLIDFSTAVWLPIVDIKLELGKAYLVFMLFVMVGASNAVNLTDGLDGLASGCMAIAASCYAVICLLTGHAELAIFCAATVGACIGFLRFNFHPAKVFMGDTGSLALGGAFAAVGILSHTEVLLAVVGFIFVCEALSVILQVISFQTTGRRIFRMSPLHHHFELGGWSEVKVVFVFWTVGLIFGVIGLLMLN